MAFFVCLFLFIVRTSSVCLILDFHPKKDAETKLESRTYTAKVYEAVASRYRRMLRKWTAQTGKIGTKTLKRREPKVGRLGKRLLRIAKACILFLRGRKERLFSLIREPLHTVSKPQVRT
ncbi:Uncharacterised protein [Porphyromonas crevioricanis]|uniref:Uncharacterized protein n=1 Tax=Porphyromonas crevioricanis TaxID=393921 RepID=A0A2X4PP77_9PORP|nr:hypothetical protein [Porphyromonas gingivicanis]GAD06668.1 hypothetical protein PORCAN_266 [Porphyromonas crevioricanis JCM 13913]SQH73358.1 Uncharacterised protein [Porphyromonas crevioricanis]